MLEASAHQQLKNLLRQEGSPRWPHHLSLSRLVARSLRRHDHTLIRLAGDGASSWWLSLLVPIALSDDPVALVLGEELRARLLAVELPRLRAAGLALAVWERAEPPPGQQLWLLEPAELVRAWRGGSLGNHQLVIPQLERITGPLRDAMGVTITPLDWERLWRSQPAAAASLMALHRQLGEKLVGHPGPAWRTVAVGASDEAPLRQLLALLGDLPAPWPAWQACGGDDQWCSWACIDRTLLQWQLQRQPLEPLELLSDLFENRGVVLLGGQASETDGLARLGLSRPVTVSLADPPPEDPLPLYAPRRQPLPNTPIFADHLLDQCRRLVLAQTALSVVLLDDRNLRNGLAAALAAEFGSRVCDQTTAPEDNGVLCASWSWWLDHQQRLPLPGQVVVAMLPIASLEDPLTAARVGRLRQQGRDWFRELLLPEAIGRLQRGLWGLRRGNGRLAVLDGRLRGRSWGGQILRSLEPWVDLPRLLPG
ncbi:MAG: helicase [Cyanobacteriota bacterium]|nr:helicase [Cyanobacteriota bacterium]